MCVGVLNRDDIADLNGLAEIIRKDGAITKGMLYKKCNLNIWRFRELARFLPDVYDDIIYDERHMKFISQLTHTRLIDEAWK